MEVNTRKTTTKFPAFPANYVTLAQLQESWLKERHREKSDEREEKEEPPKQLEEDHTATTTTATAAVTEPLILSQCESVSPETEVAGDEETETKKTRKKSKWKRTSEESESPLLNLDHAGKEESDSRVLPGNRTRSNGKRREIGRENGESEENRVRVLPGVADHNGDGSGGKGKGKGEGKGKGKGVALDQAADIDSPVNGEIGKKKNGGFKRYGDKSRKISGEVGAERNSLDEKDGALFAGGWTETGSEINELDNKTDVEPKGGVSSIRRENGGRRRNEKRGEARNGIEAESKAVSGRNSLDEKEEAEAGFRALSVNVNDNEEAGPVRRNQNGRNAGGGTETGSEINELDNKTDVEPKGGVSSIRRENGGRRRNKKRGEARNGIEAESKALSERNSLDEKEQAEAGFRALSVNVNDNEEAGPVRRTQNGRNAGGGTETGSEINELDNKTDVEPKGGVSAVKRGNGGMRRNEKRREEKNGIEAESKAESGNEGSRKNGKKGGMWVRRSRNSGQVGESKTVNNKLDQSAGEEYKVDGETEVSRGTGVEAKPEIITEEVRRRKVKEDDTASRDQESGKVISCVNGLVTKGHGGSRKSGGGGGGGGRTERGNSGTRKSSSSHNNRGGYGGSRSYGFKSLGRDWTDDGMVWVKKEVVGEGSGGIGTDKD